MSMSFRQRVERAKNWLTQSDLDFREATKDAKIRKYLPQPRRKDRPFDPETDGVVFDVAAYMVSQVIERRLSKLSFTMIASCQICRFGRLQEVNTDLVRNGYWGSHNRYAQLAKKYPFTIEQLKWHAFHCIPEAVKHYMAIIPDPKEHKAVSSVLEDLQAIVNELTEGRRRMLDDKEYGEFNKSIPHSVEVVKLKGKVTGEVPDGQMIQLPSGDDERVNFNGVTVVVPDASAIEGRRQRRIAAGPRQEESEDL